MLPYYQAATPAPRTLIFMTVYYVYMLSKQQHLSSSPPMVVHYTLLIYTVCSRIVHQVHATLFGSTHTVQTWCSLNIVFFPLNVVFFLNFASSAAALVF